MAVAEYEEIIPNPRGLIRTFAGHNYTFGESVADLIDNSLDAGATCVRVIMEFDGPQSCIVIADNGAGLAESQIKEALRPGTERDYDNDDKGKFGLGVTSRTLRQ
jgi:signal transduction histidine kinase